MRTTPLVLVAVPYEDDGHEVELERQVDRPGEVGKEDECALQHPDEQRADGRRNRR